MHNETNENKRLLAMQRYLDFSFEKNSHLQDIALLSSNVMGTPVSLITLLDKDIQWVISSKGIDIKQMPRETSFCTHAIQQDEIMVVNDARLDERFKDAPLVKNAPNVCFYAGVPLKSKDGYNIGTLCVFDDKPRDTEKCQLECLHALTRQVINIMNLNMSIQLIRENNQEIETQYSALRKIAYIQSHEVRAPLCNAIGAMDMMKMEGENRDPFHFNILEKSLHEIDHKIHQIVDAASIKLHSAV